MSAQRLHRELLRALLGDEELAVEFYLAASEIVDDFEEWGPVLQANERSEYDESSPIVRLKSARNRILASISAQPT